MITRNKNWSIGILRRCTFVFSVCSSQPLQRKMGARTFSGSGLGVPRIATPCVWSLITPPQPSQVISDLDFRTYLREIRLPWISNYVAQLDRQPHIAVLKLSSRFGRIKGRRVRRTDVNVLEKQVDQDGVSLLLRFHPVASDMRQVVSVMMISTGLERIGD